MTTKKVTTSQFLGGLFRKISRDPVVEEAIRSKVEEIANFDPANMQESEESVDVEGEEVKEANNG